MSAGNPNLAEQVVELQTTVAQLQQDVDDTRRQSDKVCIVFQGAALAQRWGESEFDTLQRVVWEGWSRTLVHWEIEDCHALSKQDGQPRFIASFRDRKMHSNFWFILNHPPTGPGIHASRHLTAKTDLRMKFIARVMERHGEIHSYWFNWRSGKLQCSASYPTAGCGLARTLRLSSLQPRRLCTRRWRPRIGQGLGDSGAAKRQMRAGDPAIQMSPQSSAYSREKTPPCCTLI